MDEKTQKYSCFTCHTHFELDVATEKSKEKPKCPNCDEIHIGKRCEADPIGGCHCALTVQSGIKYCDVCGKITCPTCGDHDVIGVSRVTGYLSDINGWGASKQQELKDRNRYNIT